MAQVELSLQQGAFYRAFARTRVPHDIFFRRLSARARELAGRWERGCGGQGGGCSQPRNRRPCPGTQLPVSRCLQSPLQWPKSPGICVETSLINMPFQRQKGMRYSFPDKSCRRSAILMSAMAEQGWGLPVPIPFLHHQP